MKTYHGERANGRVRVWVDTGEREYVLPIRLDLRNHSPDGFNWGYGGSGPAQLALALLADLIHDEELVLGVYQSFKRVWIASLAHDTWSRRSNSVLLAFTSLLLPGGEEMALKAMRVREDS